MKSSDRWAVLIVITLIALALTALATAGNIRWPFLRGVVEAVGAFGLTEPFAALFAALAGWMARGRLRRRDRLSASLRRNSGSVRVHLMITHTDVKKNVYLLVRDFGIKLIGDLIQNFDVLDYLERKLSKGSFSSPALELDGPHGDVALASLVPWVCAEMMRIPQKMKWCVVVPGYWEDPEDVDVLHLAVIPEEDLRKFTDVNYCFALLVERTSHASQVLFMRDAALRHFKGGRSPFARRQLPVDRRPTPDSSCARPCFDRPDLQTALIALGLAMPQPSAQAVR